MNVGQKISHYTLEDKIGEGGFGDVFRAKDDLTGMDVAIKCSPPSNEQRLKDFEQRFMREVSCISKLNHPAIVQLFDYGALPDGSLFLVMEYVCGLNLDVLIKRDAPYSYIFASDIILQILDALSVAHAQGIVHRDLKPANIMLVKQGLKQDVVKLLDFGIAKAFNGSEPDLTQQSFDKAAGFGTPQYMPPEQFYGKKIGPYTDLYAVGLLFLELLTGKPAVSGKSLSDILEKQLKIFPDIPAPFNQGPLSDIFRCALAKQPDMRYQSAGEMARDIENIRLSSPASFNLYANAAANAQNQWAVPLVKASTGEQNQSEDFPISQDELSTIDQNSFLDEFDDKTLDATIDESAIPFGDDPNNFNTMIFDSDAVDVPSHAKHNRSLYDEIKHLQEISPTDDMSRIDTATLPQSLQNPQPTAKSPLPPPLPATPAPPSQEFNIPTTAFDAHPELNALPRKGPIPLKLNNNPNSDVESRKTVMLDAADFPQSTADLPVVFHQQSTQFLPSYRSNTLRPTRYNDGFFSRLRYRFVTSSFGMAFLNAAPIRACARAKNRLVDFIDLLYEKHFSALVAAVCALLVVLCGIFLYLVIS